MKQTNVTAIILAGGIGSRMKSDRTKQNIEIMGKTVLERTLSAFCASELVTDIIAVVRDEEILTLSPVVHSASTKPVKVVTGGSSRARSAKNGFSAINYQCDFVAIHDCARCLITAGMIDKVLLAAFDFGAATAACPVTDTVKTVDEFGTVTGTLPREKIYRAQTPQVFSTDIYRKALESFDGNWDCVTDDNMLVEAIGAKIRCVDLGAENIKITTSEDIKLAEFILRRRGESDV